MATAHFPRGRYTPARSLRVLDDHESLDLPIHRKSIEILDAIGFHGLSAEVEPETWPAWTDLPLGTVLDAIERAEKGGSHVR